jgi:hypothetical protein
MVREVGKHELITGYIELLPDDEGALLRGAADQLAAGLEERAGRKVGLGQQSRLELLYALAKLLADPPKRCFFE